MHQPENKIIYEGPIVKRKYAIEQGLTHYFTGNPCKYGHVDLRYAKSNACKRCVLDKSINDRKKDPERHSKRDKFHYNKNRDKYSEFSRNWRLKNPEENRLKQNRYKSRKINADGEHTINDVMLILNNQGWNCVYCCADLHMGYHVDHIMPLALGGSNWPNNLQCLCPTCNMRKSDKHPDDWHKEIGHRPS